MIPIAELAKKYSLADVYVFGSRAEEVARAIRHGKVPGKKSSSDVDVAVRPFPGVRLSPRDLANITVDLEDILDVDRVDLVLVSGCDPFLALDIIRGELVYAADPVDQAMYELYVLRRAGDLSPFKKAQIKMVLHGQDNR